MWILQNQDRERLEQIRPPGAASQVFPWKDLDGWMWKRCWLEIRDVPLIPVVCVQTCAIYIYYEDALKILEDSYRFKNSGMPRIQHTQYVECVWYLHHRSRNPCERCIYSHIVLGQVKVALLQTRLSRVRIEQARLKIGSATSSSWSINFSMFLLGVLIWAVVNVSHIGFTWEVCN